MKLNSLRMIQKLPTPAKVLRRTTIAFVLFILFLSFTPWIQNAPGSGRVIAFSPTERPFTVHSPLTGRINKWYVDEGSVVEKGSPIVEVVDIDPDKLQRLKRELSAILIRIEASKQALVAAENHLKRQRTLFEEGINSKRQYELAEIEYSRYKNELAKAEIERLDVEVRIARQSTQLITSPTDGTVLKRVTGEDSVIVQAGAALAEIVPMTQSRSVELMVSGNDIPFIKVGDTARLQFEGWPAIQFRGWPALAVGTFGGKVEFIDAAATPQGMFRVLITPTEKWPDIKYLRQGVRVTGWILMNEVPLWYELWRQYNGFPPEASPV